MAIYSMTGFGAGSASAADTSWTVEISTVNRKQLEIRINYTADLSGVEPEIRKKIQEKISRGMVTVRIVRTGSGGDTAYVNLELARFLTAAGQKLKTELGLSGELSIADLLQIPGVLESNSLAMELDDVQKSALFSALDQALASLNQMREAEGTALAAELQGRLQLLKELREKLLPEVGNIANQIKTRLLEKLAQSELVVDLNDERLLKEVLFYADRADVTEELTRLASHFQQFDGFLTGEPGGGRSMDFLLQEMFREITTLGNKAGSGPVAQIVVRFKSELEKIREQVQNIE